MNHAVSLAVSLSLLLAAPVVAAQGAPTSAPAAPAAVFLPHAQLRVRLASGWRVTAPPRPRPTDEITHTRDDGVVDAVLRVGRGTDCAHAMTAMARGRERIPAPLAWLPGGWYPTTFRGGEHISCADTRRGALIVHDEHVAGGATPTVAIALERTVLDQIDTLLDAANAPDALRVADASESGGPVEPTVTLPGAGLTFRLASAAQWRVRTEQIDDLNEQDRLLYRAGDAEIEVLPLRLRGEVACQTTMSQTAAEPGMQIASAPAYLPREWGREVLVEQRGANTLMTACMATEGGGAIVTIRTTRLTPTRDLPVLADLLQTLTSIFAARLMPGQHAMFVRP